MLKDIIIPEIKKIMELKGISCEMAAIGLGYGSRTTVWKMLNDPSNNQLSDIDVIFRWAEFLKAPEIMTIVRDYLNKKMGITEEKIMGCLPTNLGLVGELNLDESILVSCGEKDEYTIQECEFRFYAYIREKIKNSDKCLVVAKYLDNNRWDIVIDQRYINVSKTGEIKILSKSGPGAGEITKKFIRNLAEVMGEIDMMAVLVQEDDDKWSQYYAYGCVAKNE